MCDECACVMCVCVMCVCVCVCDVLRCVFTAPAVYSSASAFTSAYTGTERVHLSLVFPGHAHSPAHVHSLQDPKIFQSFFKPL